MNVESDPTKPHVVVFVTATGEKMMSRCGSAQEADAMESAIKRSATFAGCTMLDREYRDAAWKAARDGRLASNIA